MGKRDLSYWDENLMGLLHHGPGKKKDKKEKIERGYENEDLDDDDNYERLPLSQEYLNHFADLLEQFLKMVTVYFIYSDLTPEEYKAAKKRIKKAVNRMRKGSTKDFDYDRTMEAITSGDIPEKYIDGGY